MSVSRKQFLKLFLASAMAGTMGGKAVEAVELEEEAVELDESANQPSPYFDPYCWSGGVSAPPGGTYYAAWDKRAGGK